MVCAQVHEGDIVLTTQSEVDNFNYTRVNGDLAITQDQSQLDPIINLNGLSSLESVYGGWVMVALQD